MQTQYTVSEILAVRLISLLYSLFLQIACLEDNSRFSALHSRGCSKVEIQYLDSDSGANPSTTENARSTVYKEIDFVKTEAFNRTRQKVEEERKQCSDVN